MLQEVEPGEVMPLPREEAPFAMVPAECRRAGAQGHRPVAGARDCKPPPYVSAFANLPCGAPRSDTVKSRTSASKPRRPLPPPSRSTRAWQSFPLLGAPAGGNRIGSRGPNTHGGS
jgi:hypothetical protein